MNGLLADINWETVLVTSIVPILTLAGLIYNNLRKRKNTEIDTESAIVVKREPTWVELEESNRKLRAEMDENKSAFEAELERQRSSFEARLQEIEARQGKFEQKTNTRIGALSNMLYAAADQWPTDHPGPEFNPEDLDALENTDLPYVWRGRRRAQPG